MASLIIREVNEERHLLNNGSNSGSKVYSACKEMLLMLFVVCIVCYKSIEPLSFDNPAETDVFRSSPTSAKAFFKLRTGV